MAHGDAKMDVTYRDVGISDEQMKPFLMLHVKVLGNEQSPGSKIFMNKL
jgi:hypothetical protein